ncbi:MAG: 16S rRNA (cytosine(1402)-N(4))-methyltransferase RsmH [Phototrophicaceae bacterium]
MTTPHISVLAREVIVHFQPILQHPLAVVVDGTLGAGGHSEALLRAGVPHIIGMDQDHHALQLAQARLHPFGGQVDYVQANYVEMPYHVQRLGYAQVQGILLDIGVSSMQLDEKERGFSFMHDGQLDMRMNQDQSLTAQEVVNTWSVTELSDIFMRYGEEKYSRHLANVIVENRPFRTTRQLATVIEARKPAQWKEKIHPATRIFQALRIAVNRELEVLEATLPKAIDLLAPGGRLAVITFHSLEDRIVKQIFKEATVDCICPPKQPICTCDKRATVEAITRKPIVPTPDEIAQNPRSRSAKLRIVEKLP